MRREVVFLVVFYMFVLIGAEALGKSTLSFLEHEHFEWHETRSIFKKDNCRNTALLSLKKDSRIVKRSKWPDDGAALIEEGPECPKNWTKTS